MKKEILIPTCVKESLQRRGRFLQEENRVDENPDNTPINEAPQMPQIQPEEDAINQEPITNTPTNENKNLAPNLNDFQYRNDAPYPEITNAFPSLFEVKQLKWLNYGRNGELTAINTYLYQYFVLKNDFLELANSLREISVVEMEHFERLGDAIVLFGGNPNLTDGRGNVWTGRNVALLNRPREILIANIKAEEKAICEYQKAAARTQNQSLKELFERIIQDEQNHIMIFNELLARV